MNRILRTINTKENKNKIFESSASSRAKYIIIFIIASIITLGIPILECSGIEQLLIIFIVILFYIPFYAVGLSHSINGVAKIIWLGFTIFHSSIVLGSLIITSGIIDMEPIYIMGLLFGVLCIIGMIICHNILPKRTEYGTEMLGKLRGFKKFLETAEKEQLEQMVTSNPTYFYDILPFTYVLGVSDKWIKKFEAITLQAPDWYDSPNTFNSANFGSFISSTMTSAQSSMSSSSSSSSSGGSSGGGSSGGGSGGGGGSSW